MSEHSAWAALFALSTVLLLLAPMLPMWREWARPQDDSPTAIPDARALVHTGLPQRVQLAAQTAICEQVEALERIEVLTGGRFHKLSAPRIDLGSTSAAPWRLADAAGTRCVALQDLPHASPWGDGGWRVDGDCRIPASHRLRGPLVVTGHLTVEHDSLLEGSIKVHGQVRLAARTVVTGALVGQQDMDLGMACQVHGPVLCRTRLSLAPAVVLGQADQPCSVVADEIVAAAGAVVHGSVWARRHGQVT
jgi:hypothetical protein